MEGNSEIAAVGQARQDDERYAFGEFELDVSMSVLLRNGQPLKLNPKSIEVLAYLLQNRDRVVPQLELMRSIWPDVRVNAGSVRQAIWEIRRTLDQPGRAEIVETVWGRGYRFNAAVERCETAGPSQRTPSPLPVTLERWACALGEDELVAMVTALCHLARRRGLSVQSIDWACECAIEAPANARQRS
jgi:DNA-binding winged helix-turn-helix (wHTH) protein